jgi:hypothetical protein
MSMQLSPRAKATVPYLIGLVVTAGLWTVTNGMTFDGRPGQIAPTFWPRVALGLIALSCVYEILRLILSSDPWHEPAGLTEALDRSEKEAHPENEPKRSGVLLAAGIALTIGYALLIGTLGFLLCTFMFVVLFMYLGGYRNHLVIWASSTFGVIALAFVFLKVAYVSLPRGEPPFAGMTQSVLSLLHIQ